MWSTVKNLGIVNKAEVDVFLQLSCFFYDPADIGNLISGFSAFPKSSLNICKFLVHVLLKHSLENFKYYFASVWDECNCAAVWTTPTTWDSLCPWGSPGKNTAVGSHRLLEGVFLIQGPKPALPHCRRILYHLSHQESHPHQSDTYMFQSMNVHWHIIITQGP